MAYVKSETAQIFDEAVHVTLRDVNDAAETASAAEVGIKLDTTSSTAYWESHRTAFAGMAIVLRVTEMDVADTDEVYVIDVEVATDLAFTTAIKVHGITVPEAGNYVLLLNGPTVDKLAAGADYIRTNLTASGTTPSIKYGAWITKSADVGA